jgi:DNA-binding response OmpR family regulator
MKILINALDDESVILEWLENIFYDEIFDLKVFKTAPEFIAAFSPEIDLIITDLRVPGYDLFSTLEYFNSINKGVYIIVISAYFDEAICERLFELGVDRIVRKGGDVKWIHKIAKYVNDLFPRIYQRTEILQE